MRVPLKVEEEGRWPSGRDTRFGMSGQLLSIYKVFGRVLTEGGVQNFYFGRLCRLNDLVVSPRVLLLLLPLFVLRVLIEIDFTFSLSACASLAFVVPDKINLR